MDQRSAALIITTTLLILLVAAFSLDAYSQLSGRGHYAVPAYLIDFVKLAMQAAFGAVTFTTVRGVRKIYEKKKSDRIPIPLRNSSSDDSQEDT
jgi:hypothetical protein